MKKILLLIALICAGQSFNAQALDPTKYIAYFPFDGNLNDKQSSGVTLTPKDVTTPTALSTDFSTSLKKFGSHSVNWSSTPAISSGSTFDVHNSYSISIWVYFNTLSGSRKIFSQSGGVLIQVISNVIKVNIGDGLGTMATDVNPSPGQWYHIAVTVDRTDQSTGAKVYIDGTLKGTSGTNVADTPDTPEYNIGILHSHTLFSDASVLDAHLDDLFITSEALSAAQVSHIYTKGIAGATLDNNKIDDQTIEVYPNPVRDVLTVSGVDSVSLDVYSMVGEKLASAEGNSINVSQLSSGYYILKVTTKTGTVIKKIAVY